jgi:hypothetical protein
MGEYRCTTIIPAYDIAAGREYQGLFTLIGSDFMTTRADDIGMCPVVVSVPDNYKTARGTQQAWQGFMQHLFGARPDEDEWWAPVYGGINEDLFDAYSEWMKYLLKDADQRGVIAWHADLDIEAQLYESNLLPVSVEESACHMCARPGDWTLVLTTLLHQEAPGGPLHRWNWLPPSAVERDMAQQSHLTDDDEFTKRCVALWDDYRAGMDKDEDSELKEVEFLDLAESDYQEYLGDIETQVAEDSILMAKEAHHPLWFPPRRLIEGAIKEVTAASRVAEDRYGKRDRRTLDLITEPLDRWLEALVTENSIRVQMEGYI